MSDLISKEKLIQHLEKEGGMNVPAWLRENIENAPTEKVYVVGYQNATEEPVITVFDNREAADKWFVICANSRDRAWLDECPIYTQLLVMGEDEE